MSQPSLPGELTRTDTPPPLAYLIASPLSPPDVSVRLPRTTSEMLKVRSRLSPITLGAPIITWTQQQATRGNQCTTQHHLVMRPHTARCMTSHWPAFGANSYFWEHKRESVDTAGLHTKAPYADTTTWRHPAPGSRGVCKGPPPPAPTDPPHPRICMPAHSVPARARS